LRVEPTQTPVIVPSTRTRRNHRPHAEHGWRGSFNQAFVERFYNPPFDGITSVYYNPVTVPHAFPYVDKNLATFAFTILSLIRKIISVDLGHPGDGDVHVEVLDGRGSAFMNNELLKENGEGGGTGSVVEVRGDLERVGDTCGSVVHEV